MKTKEIFKILRKFVTIRNKYKNAPRDKELKEQFEYYQDLCVQKFKYIVIMRASKYRSFSNYQDLLQEGTVALLSALRTFKPRKGNIFAWIHKYVGTKIAREANKHSVMRIPMQKTKKTLPIKVKNFPLMIDFSPNSHQQIEHIENKEEIVQALNQLSRKQRKVIQLFYGLNDITPYSLNKIAKRMKMSVGKCMLIRNEAMEILKQHFESCLF